MRLTVTALRPLTDSVLLKRTDDPLADLFHLPPLETGQIQLELPSAGNEFTIIAGRLNLSPCDSDGIRVGFVARPMPVYPTRHVALCGHGFDLPRFQLQSKNRSDSRPPL